MNSNDYYGQITCLDVHTTSQPFLNLNLSCFLYQRLFHRYLLSLFLASLFLS